MILREQKSPRCSHLHLHPEDLIDWTRHVLMSQFSEKTGQAEKCKLMFSDPSSFCGAKKNAEDPPLVLPGGVKSDKDTG